MKKVAELISSTKRNISDCKKRLQQLEKVAEEVKFRRDNKKIQKNKTGWKK